MATTLRWNYLARVATKYGAVTERNIRQPGWAQVEEKAN